MRDFRLRVPALAVSTPQDPRNGSDLRWFFVGSLLSNFNDAGVLDAGAPAIEALSNDGSSAVIFGFRGGNPVIAPQRPVRSQGGFVNLGFPLGRIFRAEPTGPQCRLDVLHALRI
jgi:hypothetical protein